eukprot:CFRG6193T1
MVSSVDTVAAGADDGPIVAKDTMIIVNSAENDPLSKVFPGQVSVINLDMYEGSTEEKVKAIVANSKVIMFSKTTCEFCKEAKKILSDFKVAFTVADVDSMQNGDSIYNAVKCASKLRTVPIIYINSNLVGGCSDLKRMEASGELLRTLRPIQDKTHTEISPGVVLFSDVEHPWEGVPAVRPLFAFPDTLNNHVIRLKSFFIACIGCLGVVFWHSRYMHCIIAGLFLDFMLSFLFGGTFSILSNIAEIFVCRFKPEWVSGPPKQFAAFCGIILSGTATIFFFVSQDHYFDFIGAVLCGVLTLAAGMECALNFCAGCLIFGVAVRMGWIRDNVYKFHIYRIDETRRFWEFKHEHHNYPEPEVIVKSTSSPAAQEANNIPLITPASAIYKIKPEDAWREKFHVVKYFQISYFMWPLALVTTAASISVSRAFVNAPTWPWETVACIAAFIFVISLCLYTAKCFLYFRKVYKEWTCPARGPMFAVPLLTIIVFGVLVLELSVTTGIVFVWIGSIPLFILTILFVARWVGWCYDIEHIHPIMMLMPIGNFVSGAALAALDYQYREIGIALSGLGFILWIALFSITVQKIMHSNLPNEQQRSSVFIWAAAPAVAAVSWISVSPENGMDTIAKMLYLASAILLVCLCYTIFPMRCVLVGGIENLTMAVHLVPASFNAVAFTGQLYDITIHSTVTNWMATAGLVAGGWLTALYSLQTVTAIVDRRIFRPDITWGPITAFNRLVHEAMRGMIAKLLTLSEDPRACTNSEFLLLWALFERLHTVHSTKEDEYLFPVLHQFVPNHPVLSEDEHEEHRLAFIHINKLLENVANDSPENNGNLKITHRLFRTALVDLFDDVEEHMLWEEQNLQPIGRKYVPMDTQKRVVRIIWESVPTNEWRVLVPNILRYMPYHSMRVRWLRALLWAMPERGEQLGLYIYHGVSDVMWNSLLLHVPQIIPRMRGARESTEWVRYH